MAKDKTPKGNEAFSEKHFSKEKNSLREYFRNQWELLKDKDNLGRQSQQQMLSRYLVAYLKNRPSGETWAAYRALDSEINVDFVFEQSTHLNWVFPKVTAKLKSEELLEDKSEELSLVLPGKAGFAKGRFGLFEPVISEDAKIVSPDLVHGFLVPASGFDRSGNRLGKGKGFYDRLLADAKGIKIGVTVTALVVDKMPTQSWDVKMDLIATEQGILEPAVS